MLVERLAPTDDGTLREGSRDELQWGKGIENLRRAVARGYIHKNAP